MRAASTSSPVTSQICSSTSRGIIPEAARTATPAAIRRLRPATRTMKNSSRLLAKIARKRVRSSSGQLLVLGERQHALVEAQPGQLAVEEAVLEVAVVEGRFVVLVGRVDVEHVRGDHPQARVQRPVLGVGADGRLEALGGHAAESVTAR